MRTTKMILTLFIIFMLAGCSDTENVDEQQDQTETNDTTEQTQTAEQSGPEPETEDNNADYEADTYTGRDEYEENKPPEIKSIVIETISANPRDGFRANIDSEDPEGDKIDYIYQWKLNGEDIQGATEQVLEWGEEFSKGDTLTLEVIPYDDEAEGIWKSEGTITIPNAPPVIKSNPEGAVEGNSFNYQVVAEDPDGDPVTISLKNAPDDMALNSETGQIVWEFSSDDAGDYNLDVIATDDEGAYSVQNVTFTISRGN